MIANALYVWWAWLTLTGLAAYLYNHNGPKGRP